MKNLSIYFFLTLSPLLIYSNESVHVDELCLDDQKIKNKIIEESIKLYPGNCPCPYNRARNGSRCGKRSAYSRKGGYSPICYQRDISDEMLKEFKASNCSQEKDNLNNKKRQRK